MKDVAEGNVHKETDFLHFPVVLHGVMMGNISRLKIFLLMMKYFSLYQ